MAIKNTKQDLMNDFNDIDMDDFDKVELLAKNFTEWCGWNKSYPTIEVIQSKEFADKIVVIHNLFETSGVKICDNWDFIEDVKYLISEYVDLREDDLEYCVDFWVEKFDKLLE